MNPYYLPEIGYPFANGGYSSAGSAVSSPAPGPSNVPSAAASSTGYGSAHHTPHPHHSGHHAHAHAAYGAAATAPPPAAPAPIPTSGPLVHPHQDLNSFLESFWARQMDSVERETPDFKTYNLPLARIKKVMKSDEEVKMISAEAPIMFSKACEIFISELTCRAWLVAEGHKRRTLQKSDVAAAIAFSDVFDFLIDIVPRDDGTGGAAATTSADNDAQQDAEGEDAPAQQQQHHGQPQEDGEGGDAMYREYVRGEDGEGFA